MKAEEIRSKDILRSTIPGENVIDCAYFLQEIAAQFAEFNDHLHVVAGFLQQIDVDIAELNSELRRKRMFPRRTR